MTSQRYGVRPCIFALAFICSSICLMESGLFAQQQKKADAKKANEKNTTLTQEADGLEQAIGKLTAQINRLSKASPDKDVKQAIDKLVRELNGLQQEVGKFKSSSKSFEEKLQGLRDEVNGISDEIQRGKKVRIRKPPNPTQRFPKDKLSQQFHEEFHRKLNEFGRLEFRGMLNLDQKKHGEIGKKISHISAAEELEDGRIALFAQSGKVLIVNLKIENGDLVGVVKDDQKQIPDIEWDEVKGIGGLESVAMINKRLFVSVDSKGDIFEVERKASGKWGLKEKPALKEKLILTLSGFDESDVDNGIEAMTGVENRLLCIAEKQTKSPKTPNRVAWLFPPPSEGDTNGDQPIEPNANLYEFGAVLSDDSDAPWFHVSAATTLDNSIYIVHRKYDRRSKTNKLAIVELNAKDLEPQQGGRLLFWGEYVDEKKDRRFLIDNTEAAVAFTRDKTNYLLLISDNNGDPNQKTLMHLFEIVDAD